METNECRIVMRSQSLPDVHGYLELHSGGRTLYLLPFHLPPVLPLARFPLRPSPSLCLASPRTLPLKRPFTPRLKCDPRGSARSRGQRGRERYGSPLGMRPLRCRLLSAWDLIVFSICLRRWNRHCCLDGCALRAGEREYMVF